MMAKQIQLHHAQAYTGDVAETTIPPELATLLRLACDEGWRRGKAVHSRLRNRLYVCGRGGTPAWSRAWDREGAIPRGRDKACKSLDLALR